MCTAHCTSIRLYNCRLHTKHKRKEEIALKWNKKDFNYFVSSISISIFTKLSITFRALPNKTSAIFYHFSTLSLFIHWLVNMPRFPSHNDDDEVILYPFENKLDTHIYGHTTTILSIILLHSIFEHSFYHPR